MVFQQRLNMVNIDTNTETITHHKEGETLNILFLSLIEISSLKEHNIYTDLLREFVKQQHNVYIISPSNKKGNDIIKENNTVIVRIPIGEITKTNIIKKGINTLFIEPRLKNAIKKYYKNRKFDLILYPTPPITFANVVKYVKNRDGAKSYLMLKDIFPQNAVDMRMLSTKGMKGFIYKYFRRMEKKLYAVSDCIGCMSPANVEYLLKHNAEISPVKVEICPNSIEVRDLSLNDEEKISMREKYDMPVDKKIFVYGGNLGKPQGVPFIIDCLKSQLDNQKAFFLIIGSGTEYGKLEEFFTQSKPTNMKLMRSLPKDEYDRMIAACDVGMIFLDHRFTIPNFPSRLLGYMQAKLPVLACTDPNTDIGKIIVDGGFGWWCESNDVQSFSKIIDKAMAVDNRIVGNKELDYLLSNYTVNCVYKKIEKFILDNKINVNSHRK